MAKPRSLSKNPHAASAIRVLLVEDHPMFRERLAQVIEANAEMSVCGEADNTVRAIELIRETSPQIVVADITLNGSDGLSLMKDLRGQGLATPVLILSMHEEELYAERALRAGARGYITKAAAANEIVEAIQRVLAGGMYFSPDLTARMILKSVSGQAEEAAQGVEALSDRELEVFRQIGLGKSLKQIAALLNLADSTVETYIGHIREKLDVKSAAEVYARAAQWRIEKGL